MDKYTEIKKYLDTPYTDIHTIKDLHTKLLALFLHEYFNKLLTKETINLYQADKYTRLVNSIILLLPDAFISNLDIEPVIVSSKDENTSCTYRMKLTTMIPMDLFEYLDKDEVIKIKSIFIQSLSKANLMSSNTSLDGLGLILGYKQLICNVYIEVGIHEFDHYDELYLYRR